MKSSRHTLPSVAVDRKQLVVVDIPVLALADELAECRECDVIGGDCHILAPVRFEIKPIAVEFGGEPTFGSWRRQQVCAISAK